MDCLEIFLIVGAIILAIIVIVIVAWCLNRRRKKKTFKNVSRTERDFPWFSCLICNNDDVEAQRETYNVNSSRDHTTRSSSSNNPQQQSFLQQSFSLQSLPQQNKPQQGWPQQNKPQQSLPQQNKPQHSLPQQNKPQQSLPQQNKPQQGWPQQNKPQFSASSSGTRPVQVVLPSHQQQKDSSKKFTQYAKIDLHQFTLKEAMPYFKTFLNDSMNEYKLNQNSRQNRFIEVITGRGKHSPDGIAVIKPAVENYLITHQYKYVWDNPGRVRIDLLSLIKSGREFSSNHDS